MPRTFSPAMDAACLAQLPAYVDDVLEYATASAFPVAGEAGKLYVALGETSVTAYLVWVWCSSGWSNLQFANLYADGIQYNPFDYSEKRTWHSRPRKLKSWQWPLRSAPPT